MSTVETVAGELKPWDIQDGENARQYGWFARYRDLGPERTLERAAGMVGKSIHYLQKCSAIHKWVERCDAFDRDVAKRTTRIVEETTAEVRARHARAAKMAHGLFATRVTSLARRSVQAQAMGHDIFEDVTLPDAARGLAMTAREEREARGMLPVEPGDDTKAIIAIVRMSLDDL
jgi:hypothetical protein